MDHYRDSFYTKPYVIKKKQNVVLIPEPCVTNNGTTPFCLNIYDPPSFIYSFCVISEKGTPY